MLNDLAEITNQIADSKGFTRGRRTFGDVIALVHSELSEALEEFRDGHDLQEIYYNPDNPFKPEGIPIELADAIIRIVQFCGEKDIDIDLAVELKIEYNRTRPHMHGGKKL